MVEKDEVRSQIIDVAGRIFSKYGYKKTTMDEIANGLHKGKSSIYYYYLGKEEIYKAVIEFEIKELWKNIHNALILSDNPMDKIKTYVLVRMKTIKDKPNFYEVLNNESIAHIGFIHEIRENFLREEIKIFDGFLNDGVKRGLFFSEETDLTAVAIVTAMKGLEVPLLSKDNAIDLEKRIESLLNMLFYGLIKR